MRDTTAARMKQAMLDARAKVPVVRAAMGPVELLERQCGEYVDQAGSLLAAFKVALDICAKHPRASAPFEADAAEAGFAPADRDWVAKLLLGAELRRGLLTYRVAGLTPRASEAELAQALKRRADAHTRQGLDAALGEHDSEGRRMSESELYLNAWGEGLLAASGNAVLAAQAVQPDNDRFIRLVLGWGQAAAARA